MGYNRDMPKHPEQTNIRLDEQAKQDARLIAQHYNLNGMAAAIRFALREIARQIEESRKSVAPSG